MFGFLDALLAFEVPELPLEDYWDHFSDKIDQAYKSGTYKGQSFSEQGGPGNEQAANDIFKLLSTKMHSPF